MKLWHFKNGLQRGVGLTLALAISWSTVSGAGPAFAEAGREKKAPAVYRDSVETEPALPAAEGEEELLPLGETRAAATLDEASGLYYTVENGQVTITGYANKSSVTALTVPAQIAGLPVTAIGYNAFTAFPSKLESVTLPEGLKGIGSWAFQGCEKLKSVNIPTTVTVISERAFESTAVTDITLPEGLTELGRYAFRACPKLNRVTVPGSLRTMGSDTFASCSALTECTLAEGVTAISDNAFSGCTALTRITFPQSLTSIGFKAFEGCAALKEVSLPLQLNTIGNLAFAGCTALTELSLPPSLKTVGRQAFQNCTALKEILIPTGVTSAYQAFDGSGVERAVFAEGRTAIPEAVFFNCESLTSVLLPESVTLVEGGAFEKCVSLVKVDLPEGLEQIGGSAFKDCSALSEVVLPASLKRIGNGAFQNCVALAHINIPSGMDNSNGTPFSGSGLVSISFEEGLKKIGSYLFAGCSRLVSIYLPESVTLIDDYAFIDCSSLKTLYLAGDSVRFDYHCLEKCGQMTSLYFYGAAPSEISASVFQGHPDVGQVTLYYIEGESGWTTPTWNGFRAVPFQKGLLLNEPVYNNGSEYHHLVYDVETGEPIQGAKVVANNAAAKYTDAEGMVILPTDTVVLTVEAEGYAPVTEYYTSGEAAAFSARRLDDNKKLGLTGLKLYDRLATVTAARAMVDGTAHDIFKEPLTLNKTVPPETLSVSFTAQGDYATARLIQGNKTIATLVGSAIKSFTNLKISQFLIGEMVEIRLYDAAGKTVGGCRTNLKIVFEEVPEASGLSVEFGEGITVELPDDIPFVGGMTFQPKLPELPASLTVDAEGVHIAFGGELKKPDNIPDVGEWDKEDWQKAWKDFKGKISDTIKGTPQAVSNKGTEILDAMKKAKSDWKDIRNLWTTNKAGLDKLSWGTLKGTFSKITPSVEGAGYLDISWGNGWQGEGQALLTATLSGIGAEANVMAGPVPLVLGVELKGSLETGITVTITDIKAIKCNFDADLGVLLEIDAGVGVRDVASAGVYGEGASNWRLNAGSQGQLRMKEWVLHGGFGVRGQVLIFEARKEIWSGDWYLIIDDQWVGDKGIHTASRSKLRAAMNEEGNYQLMSRDYLEERSDWLAGGDGIQLFSLTAGNVKTMQAGAYPGAEPQLVTNGTTTMMVYADDDETRSSANRTRLMYSLYDPAADSWAQPQPVTPESTAADFTPVTAVVGNDVYVLWQSAKTELTENMSMTEMAAAMELKLARYDEAGGAFTDVQTLTDNGIYETAHRLTDVNGTPVVYWVENSAGDMFCQTGTNTVCRAEKSGDRWTRSVVAAVEAPIATLRAGTLGTEEAVAWTVETEEAEEEGRFTRKGYLWTAAGQTVRDLGAVNAVYFTPAGTENTPALAWYDGTDLKYITAAAGEPANMVETGTLERTPHAILISGDGSKHSILYTGSHGEGGANLYAVTYDSVKGQWGLPVALTEESELYVEGLSAAYVGQDLVAAFQRSQVDEALNRTVELCWLKAPEGAELELVDARCPDNGLVPGGPVTIQVTVRNKGTLTSGGTETITIDGINVTQTVTVPELRGGEETEIEISGVLPESLTDAVCTLELNGTTADVPLDLADLELTVERYILGRKNVGIATVTNKGTKSSDGVLNFTRNNGETVYQSVPFAKLAAGESTQVTFTVENDFFADGDQVMVAVELDSTEKQQFYGNDSTVLDLHKVYGDVDWAELTMTEAGALTGQLCNDTAETVKGTLVLAAYDTNGRQLATRTTAVELAKETKQALNWSRTGAAYYKVFLLTEDNAPWLTETVSPVGGEKRGETR